jgi:palmitoyltransferase
MIESWEIERHEALVERARKTGGWVYGNGGQKMRVQHQEFPYDIGIWKNLVQGMGTTNVLAWFLPFGGGPSIDSAAHYEVNGFEDEGKVWPPPDPDKLPRVQRKVDEDVDVDVGDVGDVEAFRRRQREDWSERSRRTKAPLKDEPDNTTLVDEGDDYESEFEEGIDGEEGWTNAEGDRLRDFGVDEDAELVAEAEIPLGELLRRRKARAFI